jgi:hypothetical protein
LEYELWQREHEKYQQSARGKREDDYRRQQVMAMKRAIERLDESDSEEYDDFYNLVDRNGSPIGCRPRHDNFQSKYY